MPIYTRERKKSIETEEDEEKEDNMPDIILQLLDPENTDPIVLQGDDGEPLEFDQLALIPYNDNLYPILKPRKKLKGVKDTEALVFRIDFVEENEEFYLNYVTDQEVIDATYQLYAKLFEEEEAKFRQKVEEEK